MTLSPLRWLRLVPPNKTKLAGPPARQDRRPYRRVRLNAWLGLDQELLFWLASAAPQLACIGAPRSLPNDE